jgi:hypothetical protein
MKGGGGSGGAGTKDGDGSVGDGGGNGGGGGGGGGGSGFLESMLWCLMGGVLSSMLQFAFVFGGGLIDSAEDQVGRCMLNRWNPC